MIARILYTKDSPTERPAAVFAQELADLRIETELVDADSREGQQLAELYDVLSRPAVLLTRDDGQLVESWQNGLPLADEVSHLAHNR